MTPQEQRDERLTNAAHGILGHIAAQLKAGHYVVDDLPSILDRVQSHVDEEYRPRRNRGDDSGQQP